MKLHFWVFLLLSILVAGCTQTTQPDYPAWVDELIQKFESAPVGNPPQSIWSYSYNGQTVYYVPPQCCDQYGTLYDAEGNTLCAPDGGIDGKGDGKCPDFSSTRTDEQLIWKDSRQR